MRCCYMAVVLYSIQKKHYYRPNRETRSQQSWPCFGGTLQSVVSNVKNDKQVP